MGPRKRSVREPSNGGFPLARAVVAAGRSEPHASTGWGEAPLVVEGSGGSLIGWPLRPEAALSIGSGLVASVGVSVSFWIIQRREARESEKQAALHRSHLELLGRWMSERDLDRLRLENEQLLVEIIQLRDELQLNFPDVANDLKFVRDYSEDTIGRLDELTELVESLDDRVSDLDVEFARHGPGHRRWWRR